MRRALSSSNTGGGSSPPATCDAVRTLHGPRSCDRFFTRSGENFGHNRMRRIKEPTMSARERRSTILQEDTSELKAGLTPQQLETLHTMEQFHWRLRFVRRPMFQAPIPIVFHRDGVRFAVLEADGTINENPGFKIRP
jgi:hypothetical protein